MTAKRFTELSHRRFLFAAVEWLSPSRLWRATAVFMAITLLAGAVDASASLLRMPLFWLVLTGSLLALLSLRWATHDLAQTVEMIEPSYRDLTQFDTIVISVLDRFPSPAASILLGLGFSAVLFAQGLWELPPASHVILGLLCLAAGLIFGFGLLGFAWSYRLVWHLRKAKVELYRAFRLRRLGSYSCTLALIGIVPAVISWLISVEEGHSTVFVWVALGLSILVIVLFLVAEFSIYDTVSQARFVRLIHVSDILEGLYEQLTDWRSVDKPKQAELLDLIEKWECQRNSIIGYRCNLIPWDALCGKVLLPVAIGTLIVVVKVLMEKPVA